MPTGAPFSFVSLFLTNKFVMKNMTKAQLQAVCDQKGIKYTSKTIKDELIKLINAGKKSAKIGKSFNGEY